jgi:hypothetical protein
MEQKQRETGYYWVMFEGHWEVAYFQDGAFKVDEIIVSPTNLDEINETRILSPNEINQLIVDSENYSVHDRKENVEYFIKNSPSYTIFFNYFRAEE